MASAYVFLSRTKGARLRIGKLGGAFLVLFLLVWLTIEGGHLECG